MAICLEQGANDLHMVQLTSLPPHHLGFTKIQNSLSFWYQPTQIVLEKRPLNDCCCYYLGAKEKTDSFTNLRGIKLLQSLRAFSKS